MFSELIDDWTIVFRYLVVLESDSQKKALSYEKVSIFLTDELKVVGNL